MSSKLNALLGLFDTLPVSFVPESCPPSGTTYLYTWSEDLTKENDWKADGYRWRQVGGWKESSKRSAIPYRKLYFQAYDSPNSWTPKFCRVAYSQPDYQNSVLVHYYGDDNVMFSGPHRKAKKANHPNYVRTQPSVIAAIKSATGSAAEIYNTLSQASTTCSATAVPRNNEQVRNTLKRKRNVSRWSHDALHNVIEIAKHIDFVHHFNILPDLSAYLYMPEIIDIFRSLLETDAPLQVMSYDSNFTLGNFHLSVLLFRETEFDEQPAIPLAFHLHKQKLLTTHDDFFRHIRRILPEINTAPNLIFVADNEAANTFADNFPSTKRFLCWNHIIDECKHWLRGHGISKANEMELYTDGIYSLLRSPSLHEYKDTLIQLATVWSQPFLSYFVSTVNTFIDQIGAWELRQFGLDSITANQSEPFSCVRKQLQEWRDAPIDAMVLSLQHLSTFYHSEITHGRCGLGDYHQRSGLQSRSSSTLSSVAVIQPQDIVANIRSAGTGTVVPDDQQSATPLSATFINIICQLATVSDDENNPTHVATDSCEQTCDAQVEVTAAR